MNPSRRWLFGRAAAGVLLSAASFAIRSSRRMVGVEPADEFGAEHDQPACGLGAWETFRDAAFEENVLSALGPRLDHALRARGRGTGAPATPPPPRYWETHGFHPCAGPALPGEKLRPTRRGSAR